MSMRDSNNKGGSMKIGNSISLSVYLRIDQKKARKKKLCRLLKNNRKLDSYFSFSAVTSSDPSE